jgi:uncharacterized membrane protein HdeD (DUF308 family)
VRQAAAAAAKQWRMLLVAGIVSVIAGMIILSVDWTFRSLAVFVGVVFIYRGVLQALMPSWGASATQFNRIAGILGALAGIAFLAWPAPSLIVLGVFIGAYILADGIFIIAGAIEFRKDVSTWWLWLIFGVISATFGVLALDRPESSLALAITAAGIWAVIIGIVAISAAFTLRRLPDELDEAANRAQGTVAGRSIDLTDSAVYVPQQLELLHRLHREGALTDSEFEATKSRVIGTHVTAN